MTKKDGGLGVKDLEGFHISLLFKWKMRCLNDLNVVWRDLMTFRYGDLRKELTCMAIVMWGLKESL